MYKKLLVLFLFLLNVSFASAALSWAEWTANHNTDITITNGQLSEFEWTVQAVSNFQGVQGRYSIWLFRNGNNNPIRTYFYNQPTINNGAGGYINVTPSDYQNLIGDYQVKVYSVDYFGADTHVINLHVIPAIPPLTITCSANPTQGQAPLTTTYTATVSGGSGSYSSYLWNFGDGQAQTTSTNTVPHTYQNSGSYTGNVKVTDSSGNTATANCPTITVTPPPVPLTATCNAQPTNGFKPLTVNFTGTASGGSGTYYYQWTYGDGQVQNGQNKITHTYTQVGTFYPTLKVTDTNNNAVVVNCPTIHVNNYPPITGTCTAVPANGTRPLTVQFQVTAQGGSGTYNAYGWDFLGNNQLNTQGSTATYVYQNAGTYNPDVTVYDNQGNQGIISCPTITVNNPIPPLTATCNAYPTSGFKPLTVNFTGTASGGSGTYYYYWTYGDGQSQYGNNKTTHIYQNNGTFYPTLKVTDTQNRVIIVNCPTINVNNYPPITGTCHADPNSGYAPLTTELTVIVNGGSGTYTNYAWTFDDGTSQNTIINNVFHTYNNQGYYDPNVVVTDNKGNTGTIYCPQISVYQQPIINYTLNCAAYPTSGYAPLNVNFNATITTSTDSDQSENINSDSNSDAPSTPWVYTWTFGDGQSLINGPNVQHTYNVGVFYPTVKATNGNNTLQKSCPTITATQPPTSLNATCDAYPTTGEEPLTVNFTGTANGGSGTYYYYWYYDDGYSQYGQNKTTHTYQENGTYNPTLKVTDTQNNIITVNCPTINVNNCEPITGTCYINPTQGYAPLNVNITINAQGGSGTYTSYKYIFGDGQTQTTTQNKTTHTYQNTGYYNPKTIITDNKGNTGLITCEQIKVLEKPPITITGQCDARPTNGTEPLDVNLSFTTAGQVRQYTYTWTYDDGTTSTGNQSKTAHTYNKGTYNPKVKVSYQNISETFNCPTITVNEEPPVPLTATCDAYPTTGEEPLTVNFTGTANGGSGTYYYYWYYDDGYSQYGQNKTTHTYQENGTYNPTLKVTDTQNNIITVNCPTIKVQEQTYQNITGTCYANPTQGYEPLKANFTVYASGGTGQYTSYYWTFDDGQTQTTTNNKTSHTYNQGIYNPIVKVTDDHGNYGIINCPAINVFQQPIINHTLECVADPTNGYEPLNVNFNAEITITQNGQKIGKESINEYIDPTTGIECYDSTMTWAYKWIFDDGQTLNNGQNVWHTYSKGTYYPIVQATKGCLTLTAECPTIKVQEQTHQNITGTCNVDPDYGNAPLTTELSVDVHGGSGVYVNYAWDFDDGTTQNTVINNVFHTYYDIGAYTPNVVITDNKGNSGSIRCPTVNVRGYIPELECMADPVGGDAPLDVTFNAITKYMSGVIKPGADFVEYEWTFDDGSMQTTTSSTIDHAYRYAGDYYPSLKGIRANGEIVYTQCPIINVRYGNYTLTADPNGPYKDYVNTWILFDGSRSKGEIVKYVWDFGDGSTAETDTPYIYHLYNNTIGVFDVKLTVYDVYGFSTVGYTTATIIEPTNFIPDEDRVEDGLWVGRIIMTGNKGIQEVIRSDDDLYINLELANDYEYDLDDARIIIEIPELGIKQKSTAFDLRTGQEKDQSIIVPIWNAPQGWYQVKIIIQDDNVRRVKYRDLLVSNTYREGCIICSSGLY